MILLNPYDEEVGETSRNMAENSGSPEKIEMTGIEPAKEDIELMDV